MDIKEEKEYAKALIEYYDKGIPLTFTDAERDLLDSFLSELDNSIPKSRIEEIMKPILGRQFIGDLSISLSILRQLEELLKGE